MPSKNCSRWLLAKGRADQFRREIEWGAKWTGVKLDPSVFREDAELEPVNTSKLLRELNCA